MLIFVVFLILIMYDIIILDNVNIYKIFGKDYIVYNICWCNLKW